MSDQTGGSSESSSAAGLRSILSGKAVAVASVVTLPFDITEKVYESTSSLFFLSAVIFAALFLSRKRILQLAPAAADTITATLGVFGVLTILSGGCYLYNNSVGPAEAKGVLLDAIPGLEQALDPILAGLSRVEKTVVAIEGKTDELLRDAMPEKYSEKVSIKEPLEYFSVFGKGIGTDASGSKQWALRIGPSEQFAYGSLDVVLSGDFNNDGYVDALVHYWDGGNVSDGYIEGFILHKGGAQFRYVPIELENTRSIETAKSIEDDSVFTHFEMTDRDGGKIEMHFVGDDLTVTQQGDLAKTFGLATLYSNEVFDLRSPPNGKGDKNAVGRLAFDYNQDGTQDEMVCGYWDRWNVLQGCSLTLQDKTVSIGLEPLDVQCQSIVVSDVVQNGFHKLTCEYGDIRDEYVYNTDQGLYIKDGAE